ncbi:hypothetical protein [Celeribacter neptunius]|uniref:Uncharacterized protein n=1 Tax=Celeribacter neptunius TaxID=588602 RepID=A0A1I3LHQ7_9RHOB|nr:hypothetical protein [Celeribacter neptunius]SFI83935.1 hypothetical protein SAMN04487991_1024 [Celeribacter neptunius]
MSTNIEYRNYPNEAMSKRKMLQKLAEGYLHMPESGQAVQMLSEFLARFSDDHSEMSHDANGYVVDTLGAADFKQWLDEGRTHASFARLFLGRGEGEVNGEGA